MGLTGYGIYLEQKPLSQIVVEVNGETFDMRYYLDTLEYYMSGQPAQYVQFYLDPVAENIKISALIRQKANEMGFAVEKAAVDEVIKEQRLPSSAAVKDIITTQLLLDKLRAEKFAPELPDEDLQRHIQAMFLESEAQAEAVRTRLINGEDFASLASSLSLDNFTKEKSGDLGWHPRGILSGLLGTSIAIDDYAFSLTVGEISPPILDADKGKGVGYWLIKVVERDETGLEARVEAMLLPSLDNAQQIKGLLNDTDFLELSDEYSQWDSGGEHKGEIGWISPGDMSDIFDEFVFSEGTETGVISDPVKDETMTTLGGYWIINVVAEEYRLISDDDRTTLISQKLNDWVTSLEEDPTNQAAIYLDSKMREFAISKFQ